MNKKLIWFGMICTILGTMIGFYLIFTSPMPRFILFGEAHAQIEMNATDINQLADYENMITAVTNVCTSAMGGQNTALISKCALFYSLEHDIMKSFMDADKQNMLQILASTP